MSGETTRNSSSSGPKQKQKVTRGDLYKLFNDFASLIACVVMMASVLHGELIYAKPNLANCVVYASTPPLETAASRELRDAYNYTSDVIIREFKTKKSPYYLVGDRTPPRVFVDAASDCSMSSWQAQYTLIPAFCTDFESCVVMEIKTKWTQQEPRFLVGMVWTFLGGKQLSFGMSDDEWVSGEDHGYLGNGIERVVTVRQSVGDDSGVVGLQFFTWRSQVTFGVAPASCPTCTVCESRAPSDSEGIIAASFFNVSTAVQCLQWGEAGCEAWVDNLVIADMGYFVFEDNDYAENPKLPTTYPTWGEYDYLYGDIHETEQTHKPEGLGCTGDVYGKRNFVVASRTTVQSATQSFHFTIGVFWTMALVVFLVNCVMHWESYRTGESKVENALREVINRHPMFLVACCLCCCRNRILKGGAFRSIFNCLITLLLYPVVVFKPAIETYHDDVVWSGMMQVKTGYGFAMAVFVPLCVLLFGIAVETFTKKREHKPTSICDAVCKCHAVFIRTMVTTIIPMLALSVIFGAIVGIGVMYLISNITSLWSVLSSGFLGVDLLSLWVVVNFLLIEGWRPRAFWYCCFQVLRLCSIIMSLGRRCFRCKATDDKEEHVHLQQQVELTQVLDHVENLHGVDFYVERANNEPEKAKSQPKAPPHHVEQPNHTEQGTFTGNWRR